MHIVLVDSQDSFAHNLVSSFRAAGADVTVLQSATTDPAKVIDCRPDRLVIGPGPGTPEDAGCVIELVGALAHRMPILGVCLGHQAIAQSFGGSIVRQAPVHGHATPVFHDHSPLFDGVPDGHPMGRYHSLVVSERDLPAELRVTARASDGSIMALAHRSLPIQGVQFHPESVLSGRLGERILANFMHARRVLAPDMPATASAK
jgi:anthranilate synthase/aminodeoxychorismate synthase-like glutamine amidotransferase